MKLLLLLALVCVLGGRWSCIVAEATESSGSDLDLLVRIAREYRDGSKEVQQNLHRAVHFFQYAIDQYLDDTADLPQQTRSTASVFMHANYELYSMLQEYPQLKSKFSLWKLLSTAAELGHGDAQHALSTAYATGVFLDTLIPMDSNRALLLEYSASLAGHPVANMGMGYRFMNGINVDVSCDRALPHYEFAANLAASYLEEEDSLVPLIDRSRLSDVIDGSRSGGGWSRADTSAELADYYAHLAETGDAGAAHLLGTFYTTGTRHLPMDLSMALHYLHMAAQLRHPNACGILGYLVARLTYQPHPHFSLDTLPANLRTSLQTTDKVLEHVKFAAKKGDATGVLALGFINWHGLFDQPVNATRALELFDRCIHVHPDAGYYAGELRMQRLLAQEKDHFKQRQFGVVEESTVASDDTAAKNGKSFKNGASSLANSNIKKATTAGTSKAELQQHQHFQQYRSAELTAITHAYSVASALGNWLATHRLGHLAARGISNTATGGSATLRQCDAAVQAFKSVAEQGPWMNNLLNVAQHLAVNGAVKTTSVSTASSSATDRSPNHNDDMNYLTKDTATAFLSSSDEASASKRRPHPSTAKKTTSATSGSPSANEGSSTAALAPRTQALWRFLQLSVAGVEVAQFNAAQLLLASSSSPSSAGKALLSLVTPGSLRGVLLDELNSRTGKAPVTELDVGSHTMPPADNAWTVSSAARLSLLQWRQLYLGGEIPLNQTMSTSDTTKEDIDALVEEITRYYQPSPAATKASAATSSSKQDTTAPMLSAAVVALLSMDFHDTASDSARDLWHQRITVLHEMRAWSLLGLSAGLGNSDALLRLGDFHYYGRAGLHHSALPGNDMDAHHQDQLSSADVPTVSVYADNYDHFTGAQRAAAYYQKAADLRNTQGIFNLGLMHALGDGVKQDFHLAKRFYDLAAEVDSRARTPRDLALFVLDLHKRLLQGLEHLLAQNLVDRTTIDYLLFFLRDTQQQSTTPPSTTTDQRERQRRLRAWQKQIGALNTRILQTLDWLSSIWQRLPFAYPRVSSSKAASSSSSSSSLSSSVGEKRRSVSGHRRSSTVPYEQQQQHQQSQETNRQVSPYVAIYHRLRQISDVSASIARQTWRHIVRHVERLYIELNDVATGNTDATNAFRQQQREQETTEASNGVGAGELVQVEADEALVLAALVLLLIALVSTKLLLYRRQRLLLEDLEPQPAAVPR